MSSPKHFFYSCLLAIAILVLVMLCCSLIGSKALSVSNILKGDEIEENTDFQIYFHIRLPRVLLAAFVGAALACSGAVFQALLRNPLADPYILGISSGAGLGAMLAVVTGWTWVLWGISSMAVCAFIGALCTIWLVWWIGGYTGRTSGTGLLLAGVVVNSFFSALILFLTSIAKAREIQTTLFWLMGYITTPDKGSILSACAGFITAGIALLIFLAPHINVLSLGKAEARSLGIYPERVFIVTFMAAALITSIAVSLSGLVGFVGLIVPHAVRLITGPDHRRLIPFCIFGGAVFLVIADTAARTMIAPAQLPAGVITALAGGPFFLFLLIRSCKQMRTGR